MELQVVHNNMELQSNPKYTSNFEKKMFSLPNIPSIARLTKRMTNSLKFSDQYTIDLIKEEDSDEVLQLLETYFFKDEPLNKFLELGECEELKEYSLKCIPENCSFKAVNNKGEIIGVFLNGLLRKQPANLEIKKLSEGCTHPKFSKILSLMDHIDEKFNVFDLYNNTQTILDGKIVSVNSKYRGMGIASRLTEKTLEYIKEHSIPVMHVLCTSEFSALVLEKIGFREVFKLPYEDYLVNGEVVFRPEKPHTAAKVLVKEL